MAAQLAHYALIIGPLREAGLSDSSLEQYNRALGRFIAACKPPDCLVEDWLLSSAAVEILEKAYARKPHSAKRVLLALRCWRANCGVSVCDKDLLAAHARCARVVRRLAAEARLSHGGNATEAATSHTPASHAGAQRVLDARAVAVDARSHAAHSGSEGRVDHREARSKS